MREVARQFRISRTTVAKLLKERGVQTSLGMSPTEVQTAAQLYSQGLSSGQIGKQLGFDNHTILNAIRKTGLVIRQPAATRIKK